MCLRVTDQSANGREPGSDRSMSELPPNSVLRHAPARSAVNKRSRDTKAELERWRLAKDPRFIAISSRFSSPAFCDLTYNIICLVLVTHTQAHAHDISLLVFLSLLDEIFREIRLIRLVSVT